MSKKTLKTSPPEAIELFVSPQGNDKWSGRLAEPNARRTNGPLATIAAAQKAIRALKGSKPLARPVRVNLRGGLHLLKRPLVFGPADSGTPANVQQWRVLAEEVPVTYAAYRKEKPIVSGGRLIKGLREELLQGRRVWVADINDVKTGKWYFRQLFVNGQRRMRPRLPHEGDFRVAKLLDKGDDSRPWRGGNHRFVYQDGDLRADWQNLQDVEVVAMHVWLESRMRIKSIDARKHVVNLECPSQGRLIETHMHAVGAPYYVENVFEAIRPGQWYLDRVSGRLYYMPLKGEKLASAKVVAPSLEELVRFEGDAEAGKFVEALHFEGITFAHNEWRPPQVRSGWGQASNEVPGAVVALGLRKSAFTGCRFVQMGTYGLELLGGCRDVLVRGCEFGDLGGGGIKVWHLGCRGENPRTAVPPYVQGCRRISITDNEIHHAGLIYHSAVGILMGRCSANKILHNHIHHLYYSGMSIGWTWGYGDENNAYGNIIEYNHVHHIGQGILSDMGGIYTLGQAAGTRIRFNIFHDVVARGYGGWGIYPDEGSSDLLIENNLVYDCNRSSFHQHFGANNLVQNNIFAFAGQAQVAQTRGESHMTFIFRRNIVICEQPSMSDGVEGGFMFGKYSPANVTFESNLYFNTAGKRLSFAGRSFGQWQKLGFDQQSIVADPKFANAAKRDFSLKKGSPAEKIGFKEFDLSAVGPRRQYAPR